MIEFHPSYEQFKLLKPAGKPLRRFGVPEGGPCDAVTFRLAQRLLGEESQIFEMFGLATFSLTFREEGAIVVVGAERRTSLDGQSIVHGLPQVVRSGQTLAIDPVTPGAVAHLALSHSITSPGPSEELTNREGPIRVSPSVDQLDAFALFDTEFVISPRSNRVGVRLEPPITGVEDLPHSEPACPGLIQLTPSGTVIILGPDGPTIGGYRRLGTVKREDLGILYRTGFQRPVRFVAEIETSE